MDIIWNLGVLTSQKKQTVNESNEYFQFVKPDKRYVDQRLSHGTEVPTDFPAEITTTWASVDVKIVKMVDLTEFNQQKSGLNQQIWDNMRIYSWLSWLTVVVLLSYANVVKQT